MDNRPILTNLHVGMVALDATDIHSKENGLLEGQQEMIVAI